MAATIEAESPRSYFWWSGLAAISAAVSNRVWVNKQIYKLHPNLFVLLIGKSGLRKSGPPSLVRQIMERAEVTKLISGRASIEAIIKKLGQLETLKSGVVLKDASAFICSGEFSSSLVNNEDALTILTDLHDSHYHTDSWVNLLKTAGVDTLERPCLTLLSATNPTHFDNVVSTISMMGGFIARTVLVVESKKSRINDLLDEAEVKFDPAYFVPYIKKLSKLQGEFTLDKPAKMMFREWYAAFAIEEIDDKTGTSERIHDRILKVAMNISLAETTTLVIKEPHMKMAMDACIHGITLASKATMSQGLSDLAPKAAAFIDRLCNAPNHEMDRRSMLSRNWGTFDHLDLDRIVEMLDQAGLVINDNRGGKVFYKLTDVGVDFYLSQKDKQ